MEFVHKSVLFDEAVASLNLDDTKIILDGTAGGGGHSRAIAERAAQLISVDQDPDAIRVLNERLGSYSNVIIGNPYDICTESFLEIGCFDTLDLVKKQAKYLMSKFLRALMFLKKFNIDATQKVYKEIPIQDYTEDFWNSDNIDDIDNGLFDKYNVPEDIRKFVRENIQPKTKDDILGYDGKD